MRWDNSETPTFSGSAGDAVTSKPAYAERLNLYDRDGTVVAYFDKALDGTITLFLNGVQIAADADVGSIITAWTAASASGPASLALGEDADNGSHVVTLKAPAAVTANVDVVLPDAAGTIALISEAVTNGVTTKSPSENAVFDALATKADGTAGVKVYRARLVDVADANPTVTVYENSLGAAVVWTGSGGIYTGTLAAAFTADKTFLSASASPHTGDWVLASPSWTSANAVAVRTYNASDTQPASAIMDAVYVEILVYP